MTVLLLYIFVCYAFTIGVWVETSTKSNNYKLTVYEIGLMLLAPILLPIILGMEFESKSKS